MTTKALSYLKKSFKKCFRGRNVINSSLTGTKKVKAVVTMSGGVDSSVAALLLKEQGYQVCGISMKIWDGKTSTVKTRHDSCYGPSEEEKIQDALRVAGKIGIDLRILDLSREFKAEVLDYFCNEYLKGRTPNPCSRCNRSIKFDALLKKARYNGIEYNYFASGHYARVEYNNNAQRYLIKKASDLKKDQSYFLAFLNQEQLSRIIFPIGNYTKEEVRKLASDYNLGLDNKPDSQDFIASGYKPLTESAKPGPILNRYGEKIGDHRGIQFYTIGQRRGLGISSGKPLYVIDIDHENNTITASSQEELYRDEFTAFKMNWIAMPELKEEITVQARIRYRHKEAEATVNPLSRDEVHVKFREPQMAITPGQTVVFYDEDTLIGGGTIEKVMES